MSSPKKRASLDTAPSSGRPRAKSLAQKVYLPIKPTDHTVPAVLHAGMTLSFSEQAVVIISGAGNGTSGPDDIFIELADRLAKKAGLPTIRLEYKETPKADHIQPDILACANYLKSNFSSHRFLIGGCSNGIESVSSLLNDKDDYAGLFWVDPKSIDGLPSSKSALIFDSEGHFKADHESKGNKTVKPFKPEDDIVGEIYQFAAKTLGKTN